MRSRYQSHRAIVYREQAQLPQGIADICGSRPGVTDTAATPTDIGDPLWKLSLLAINDSAV
ncbi:hypothetical protein QCD79_32290, partial [Pseudomonas quasicaspiana]|nr:hypothetical protein [Pseudomonas quasicaspiana]